MMKRATVVAFTAVFALAGCGHVTMTSKTTTSTMPPPTSTTSSTPTPDPTVTVTETATVTPTPEKTSSPENPQAKTARLRIDLSMNRDAKVKTCGPLNTDSITFPINCTSESGDPITIVYTRDKDSFNKLEEQMQKKTLDPKQNWAFESSMMPDGGYWVYGTTKEGSTNLFKFMAENAS